MDLFAVTVKYRAMIYFPSQLGVLFQPSRYISTRFHGFCDTDNYLPITLINIHVDSNIQLVNLFYCYRSFKSSDLL